MLTRMGCLKQELWRNNSCECERLLLKYMQTRVYYEHAHGTWTSTRVNVNAA